MASIYDMDGTAITEGLQGCETCDEAIKAAWSIADSFGERVELLDDDGRWLVYPKRPDGSRRAAKFLGEADE